ncbi:hypothetical protein Tco_1507164 [Tanacetum coccineum]
MERPPERSPHISISNSTIEMQELSEELQEFCKMNFYDLVIYLWGAPGKLWLIDVLRRKEQKPRRVPSVAMTIQNRLRGMILAAQSDAFKQENVTCNRKEAFMDLELNIL